MKNQDFIIKLREEADRYWFGHEYWSRHDHFHDETFVNLAKLLNEISKTANCQIWRPNSKGEPELCQNWRGPIFRGTPIGVPLKIAVEIGVLYTRL